MTARLAIDEDRQSGCLCIGWWDEKDGVEGDLLLGQEVAVYEGGGEMAIKEANEHNYVSTKLREQCPPYSIGSSGELMWESRVGATKALRTARALLKQFRSDRPWPAWAMKAVEAGWKPPRGWKP